jgi:glutamine synthetase
MFENYSNIIDIEAKTMVDITNKKIIPAIEGYVEKLCRTAKDKQDIFGSNVNSGLERRIIADLSSLAVEAFDVADKLKSAAQAAESEADFKVSAFSYKDKVIPLMNRLRTAVDKAETIVPSDLWPLPSYGEMTLKQ